MLRRKFRPKKLSEQTIVITGASSGIGLATAQLAAQRGASVVLSSRNEAELQRLVQAINDAGGRATYAVADVANPEELDGVAAEAVRTFGGIDTWVNNAGISIFGKLTEVPMADKKRLFDVNFWGVVNGCRTAVHHMRERGGTIINIGSIVSDQAIPLQGIYSASKHAVQGYTNALRMELQHDKFPIAVTLVKPSAIDTPYLEHARNYMDAAPSFPPPVYAPEVVARTILKCAERPVRDITVGGAGRMMTLLGAAAPRMTDKYMKTAMFSQQQDPEGRNRTMDSLYSPKRDGRRTGPYDGHVMQSSAYTRARMSKVTQLLPWIAAAAVFAAGVRRLQG
ncbi:MAG: SDR family oxidoreductase [Acidobacteriota bacterium]|nr:SDR family oxidoreductase [Acidobacteriota bacterium]